MDAAKAQCREVVREVQRGCSHEFVLEQKGRSGWFDHPTIRICQDCGFEEQGGVYASRGDFVALGSEFVAPVSSAPAHRVPHGLGGIHHVRCGRYYDPRDLGGD